MAPNTEISKMTNLTVGQKDSNFRVHVVGTTQKSETQEELYFAKEFQLTRF